MIVAPSISPTLVKRRLTPPNLAKPRWIDRVGDAELGGDPDRGERVLDVVAARHRQLDVRRCVRTSPARSRIDDVEAVAARHRADIVAAHVGLGARSRR